MTTTLKSKSKEMNTFESKYKNYQDFIRQHYVDKDDKTTPITNTRIGNPGGKYHISNLEYTEFLDLYYRDVVSKGLPEFLTEKQLDRGGPIVVDIDLRYTYETTEKQYKKTHIDDIVQIYLEQLKHIFIFDNRVHFPIYVLEKSSVNRIEDKNITKDGIHIIFGIQADRITQMFLRDRVLEEMPKSELWSAVPTTNEWKDVFDEGISKGHTNWQMYGSQKPNHETYKLTHYYEIEYDADDGEMICTDLNVKKFDMDRDFKKLSVRYRDHISLIFTVEFDQIHENAESNSASSTQFKKQFVRTSSNMVGANSIMMNVLQINNKEQLEIAIHQLLEQLVANKEYDMVEMYDFTMTLPESYYGAGSYDKWLRVGMALCNSNKKMFAAWIAFSAKSKDFKFHTISEMYEKWLGFETGNETGLTRRSILYWSKADAPKEYEKVCCKSIDYHIDQVFQMSIINGKSEKGMGSGDADIAFILKQMYKDEFICASVRYDKWYRFSSNRWVEDECGTTLRRHISEELRDMFRKKSDYYVMKNIMRQSQNKNESDSGSNASAPNPTEERTSKIMEIVLKLSQTSHKDHILKEARELFYDNDIKFLDLLDSNPYLMCFKNGVWDFKEKVFRLGRAEDYISKCTNMEYKKLDRVRDAKIIAEIDDFMAKLFPIEQLRNYMWEHLASTLIGVNLNQTFHMYIGGGENGKSVLTDLMSQVFGEYKCDAPLCLITQARIKQGQASPDIVALKGVRYAVMQEPSKGDKINDGALKELTSGTEPIRGRNLFSSPIAFVPQMKLIVCTNEFMEVKTRDHATWRRFRVVDFMSLFTDNPVEGDPEKPYQFKIDRKLKERFPAWREVFMAMLVEIILRTDGHVSDCPMVMESTTKYREREDHIAEFIRDRITMDPEGKITKTEATNEFNLWFQSNYGRGGPSGKEVHEYLDKRLGKFKSAVGAWTGAKIRYERDFVSVSDDFDVEDVEL
jgi:P4 family phage/plasmid primase-like protien